MPYLITVWREFQTLGTCPHRPAALLHVSTFLPSPKASIQRPPSQGDFRMLSYTLTQCLVLFHFCPPSQPELPQQSDNPLSCAVTFEPHLELTYERKIEHCGSQCFLLFCLFVMLLQQVNAGLIVTLGLACCLS